MFGFMKKPTEKEKEEKERKKREKKEKKEKKKNEKGLTPEELARLEEVRRGVYARQYPGGQNGREASITPSVSSESVASSQDGMEPTYTTTTRVELSKSGKVPPPTQPKPKRGILKGKSNYGPEIPNHGVRGNLDDTTTLVENTNLNEVLPGELGVGEGDGQEEEVETKQPRQPRTVKSMVGQFESFDDNDGSAVMKPITGSISARTPHNVPQIRTEQDSVEIVSKAPQIHVTTLELIPASPSDKTYDNIDLQLPSVAPPRCPKARELDLKRQPAGDFGFTLRRGTVLQRGVGDHTEKKRTVIFAEPGPKNSSTGLLPGDRLIEVNGSNVEGSSREDIINLIRQSGSVVRLKVQPIPELSELSMRTGLEGEDVMIHEQATRTGTLQRSGSMRYKSQTARSEAQVDSERAWLSAERVWLVHKGGFAVARHLKAGEGTEALPDGKCKVKVEHGGEVLDVDEEDVERANPPQFDRVEDLATLRYLNESSILHTLRQRYGSNLIHSYAGQALLIVNPMHPLSIYSEKVIQMFRGCKPEDMPPHIYATAQIAYRNMLNTRRDQSIVFMGRSGSGKTTNARHVLHYYTVAAGSVNQILSVEKLNAMFTLLDAFGNSRTILNTSATRFTQITSLDFDHAGQIAAASIQVLMLERNRIARRPEGEPTFHVFYQMLAGIDSIVRKELQLENLSEPNLFMTPLQRTEDRQRATQAWSKIHHSMSVMGLSEVEVKAILCVLAAIYHMGVAGAVKGPNNKYQFARPAAAQKAAVCLGTTLEELARNIFSPPKQILSSGSFRGTLERDKEKSAPPEHIPGMEALEGFVVGLYAELFNALVSLVNRSLSSNIRTVSSLLILDTPGIQNPASCGRMSGAGFEDFCHNYIQERLQLLFHETVFTSPQDLYSQENVQCDFDMVISSPAPMVQLIDRASQQSLVRSPSRDKEIDHRGILWLLDEEAIVHGSNDDSFLERVLQHHVSVPEKKDSLLKQGNQKSTIILNHFQGTAPVQYSVKGWLKASRENPVARNALIFLQESHKEEIAGLFSSMRGSGGTVSGSVVGLDGSSSLRRASSIRRTYATGTAALKRKSICLQVKFQMDSVIDTVRRSRMHFVHCLLPQHNAGLCDLKASLMPPNKANTTEDIMVNVPLVRAQLRGAEMVEAIRMYRQGYPEHMQFADFRQRFECLAAPDTRATGPVIDEKLAVQQLLENLELEQSSYRLGLSQVFFRAGGMAQLEEAREEKITGTIVGVQAHCRGWLARKKLKKLKLQNIAASCIQRNVRKLMAIREWTWWRLYTKIIPLLDIHRTEEELKSKEFELEQYKQKCERLEKERAEYKQSSDRMETKLTELSADLSEEHTTSSHATEILEQETSNRLRLEKDLRDIQTKFANLQRKHEQTEMELIDARMLAASYDDFDEDEVDGDGSIYKERYDRMKRELEFTKKKQQQHLEEELENQEGLRQKLERKLADAGVEMEEQQRQISHLKRKSQRLNGEMTDIKHHLEEQTGRNMDLEKKQRKFDSEISKINQKLKEEQSLREKVQKERDALMTEKYSLEQDYKTAKMDAEFASEKIVRIEAELCDMSSVKTDDKEAVTLKRLKNELERKVLDQEEELDEQAGTIQQLEQAKLRLEMAMEKVRQEHLRELEERDVEMEDMRGSAQKKLRALEVQLEEEHEDRQNILKEKRDLEWKLKNISDITPTRDRDVEKRLRRDLRRTKSLLTDAQVLLEKHKEGAGSRNTIKQLRNQLEDVEYAKAAAVKARKGVEMEVVELQQQIDDMSKHKQEAEERCLQLGRDKNDVQTALDDNEEEMNELLKKYKALVQQQSIDCQTIQDQSKQIEDMQREVQVLKEQAAELQSRLDFMTENMVDKQMLVRLEAKIRDLESRLQLEQTTKARVESLLAKSKESTDRLTEEQSSLREAGNRDEEMVRQLTRKLRDLREEYSELERKEGEASQRKTDLEKKVESVEADYEQGQTDLRLAFKRISDLQTALEADMEVSDDSELGSDALSDDDDDDLDASLVSHRYSLTASLGSGDASRQKTNSSIAGNDSRKLKKIKETPSDWFEYNGNGMDEHQNDLSLRVSSAPITAFPRSNGTGPAPISDGLQTVALSNGQTAPQPAFLIAYNEGEFV